MTYLILVRFVIAVPITVVGPRAARDALRRPADAPAGAVKRRWEVLGYVALTAAALAVRLIALGDRPFHHDESQDAYFSWLFFTSGDYQYQPILHGPLRFYLTSLMYLLFGDSDFTARLAPALMGTAMVPFAALLRGQLGRVGAFAAAVGARLRADATCTTAGSRARTSTSRASRSRCSPSRSASSTGRAATSRR